MYFVLIEANSETYPFIKLQTNEPEASGYSTSSTEEAGSSKTENWPKLPYLSPPYVIIEKYKQLKSFSKISTLSVKLAKESYFGIELMKKSTVKGTREHPRLPPKELEQLKIFLRHTFACSPPEFEVAWRSCVEVIGQACNALRKNVFLNYQDPELF